MGDPACVPSASPTPWNKLHASEYGRCWCSRGQKRRVARDYFGNPIGKGGQTCEDCGFAHPHGAPCDATGLPARGWILNGSTAEGKRKWLCPDSAKTLRRRRKHLKASTVSVERPVAQFAHDAFRDSTRRVMKTVMKRIPDPAPDAFTQRLDPQTYRTWLSVAKARLSGLDDKQVAETTGVSEELVCQLITSSAFIYFESEFRSVMGTDAGMNEIRAKLARMTDDALATLHYYLQPNQRRPDLWAANLGAVKEWRHAMGIEPERSGKVSLGVAMLSPRESRALMVACVKEGA